MRLRSSAARRDVRARHELVEVVGRGGVDVEFGAYARRDEVPGVDDRLVPEDVQLTDFNVGRGSPAKSVSRAGAP